MQHSYGTTSLLVRLRRFMSTQASLIVSSTASAGQVISQASY